MNSPTKPAKRRPAVFNSRLRKLLLISLPVWLIAAMVCAKFVSMTVENRQGIAAYAEGDHGQARTHFSRLGVGNIAESWIAHYNRGTANFQLRAYAAAQQDFERAVQSAPAVQQCKVRINLALALEARGDDEAAAQSPDRAAELYRQADQVLAEANCADPTPTEPSTSPTPSSSGQPSQDPSAQPSQDPSGQPSQDPSGQPSDQPGEGEPTQGQGEQPKEGQGGKPDEGQSGEPSEAEQAEQKQRKEQTQERLEEKAEEADRNAKRQERREPTEPKEQDQSDPNDSEESKQDQLEKQNQESEQDSAESRDRQKGQSDKKEGKVEDPGGKKRPW